MSGKIYELPPMLSGAGEQRAEQLRAFLIRMTMELNEQSEGARGERGEKGERGERAKCRGERILSVFFHRSLPLFTVSAA